MIQTRIGEGTPPELAAPPEPAPANVRYASFGQQSELAEPRPVAPCHHHSYQLEGKRRVVRCGGCGAELDPFEVLLAYARNERTWRHWQGECIRKRAELGALQAEERRTKARLKHASRKDAAAAVAEERARGERERMQMADAARDIVTRAKRIDRLARSRP